jgi:cysteine-rich secretory family protein
MRRPASLLVVAAVVFAALPAHASDYETAFQSKINLERAPAGLGPLGFDAALLEVAGRHSADMAAAGRIFHNKNLPNEVSGWQELGENVGVGPSVEEIHKAFMASATHRAQILDPGFRGFAVGVVQSGPDLYVTELFILRSAGPPPSPAKPGTQAPRRLRAPAAAAPASPEVEAAQFAAGDRSYRTLIAFYPAHRIAAIEFPPFKSKPSRTAAPAAAALAVLLIVLNVHLMRLARNRQ